MTQSNRVNVKLSNSQFNTLKSAIKNVTEVTPKLSPNMIGDSSEPNSSRKLSKTDRQVSKLRKSFSNNSLANIKLCKTLLSKEVQSVRILGRIFGPLMKLDYS